MGGYIAQGWAPKLSGFYAVDAADLNGAVSPSPIQISTNAIAAVPKGVVMALPILASFAAGSTPYGTRFSRTERFKAIELGSVSR
jgi:hypothetical protein